MELPEKFVERMRCELGADEAARLVEALGCDPSTAVRLNPRKMTCDKWGGRPIGWSHDGYLLHERPSFTLDTDFHAGAYYVQEASSQFAGYLLTEAAGGKDRCRGMRLLDMCAAPGGKSTHYATVVGEEGLVVANEINRSRAAVLADNVRKWGTGNIAVTCNDSSRFAAFEGWFDAVAVDAPCSGEGMFRKSEQACSQWSEANVALCADRQWEILRNAFEALRCGGVLIYSTCTFNRTEDEDILRRACAEFGDELCEACEVSVDDSWGIVSGRVGVFRTFRFFPHRIDGEGMFMAVARKTESIGARRRDPKSQRRIMTPVDNKTVAELSRWVTDPQKMRFFAAGESLYGCYEHHFDAVSSLSGSLAVIYSGVAMGQIFKGRLKPDGALALFAELNREAAECCEADEEQALRFLRKQELDASIFAEGLNTVVCRGRALGFAKRVGGRVNNLYPNSLRIMN